MFEQYVNKAGMSITAMDIPPEPLARLDLYLDKNGPFSEQFRNMNSTWSLATDVELEAGLDWWTKMVESGQEEKIIEDCETIRKLIG